jgi:hypothetical protein
MLSLPDGNISSALRSIILGTPVTEECKIFYNPETCLSHMMFCGIQRDSLTGILVTYILESTSVPVVV